MSKLTTTTCELKCDQCFLKETFEPARQSFTQHYWIKLSKKASPVTDALHAGTYHFCCDKCLTDFITHD